MLSEWMSNICEGTFSGSESSRCFQTLTELGMSGMKRKEPWSLHLSTIGLNVALTFPGCENLGQELILQVSALKKSRCVH